MRDRVVRSGAFLRGELVGTLRQPGLLLTMVVGPFLVLFLFGLGYETSIPTLSTVVVGGEDEVTDRVDTYLEAEEPAGIDYQGATDDEESALEELRDGVIDLVVVLPDDAMDAVEGGEQAEIRIHQRSLDPVTSETIGIAASQAVYEINDDVLEQFLADSQDRASGFEGQLADAREQLDTLRSATDDEDLAAARRQAGPLAERMVEVAALLEQGSGFASTLGFGDDLDDTVSGLRSGADQLDQLSDLDGPEGLDEMAEGLEELDEVLTQLGSVDPAVAVRPFRAEVISETPVPVTLNRFFAPGLLALMIQHLGISLAALSLVRERRTGTLEMLRVSPATTGERLAGKSVAFLLLGGLVVAGLAALVVTVFEVPLPTDWVAFVGLLSLALLASVGVGFFVASVSTTDGQAVQLSMMLLLLAIFFSGLFMPIERIGMPIAAVSWLLPATYAFVGLQDLMLLGQSTRWWLFLGPVAIGVVTFVVARLLLPRRSADS